MANDGRRGWPVSCSYTEARAAEAGQFIILVNTAPDAVGTAASGPVSWSPSCSSSSPAAPLADERLRLVASFDLFTRHNSFTGKRATCGDEVRGLAGLHGGESAHLWHAMLALGAVYDARPGSEATDVTRRARLVVALRHYAQAISGLRAAIDGWSCGSRAGRRRAPKQQQQQTAILWTTLFLGLFELMNDASGDGWVQHMVHGTGEALRASGPGACARGPGRAFFVQARVFETCRTILFNEPTFLTEAAWAALARDMWTRTADDDDTAGDGAADEWHPLDSLLDIMVMCSQLRVRAGNLIAMPEQTRNATEGRDIYDDGCRLREALQYWHNAYALDDEPLELGVVDGAANTTTTTTTITTTTSKLLARVFYAATSVYLSGVFDYSAAQWARLLNDESAPAAATLPRDVVDAHVETVLRLAGAALECPERHGWLSPLLFLFPLRIAGARSTDDGHEDQDRRQWRRRRIVELLGRIRRRGGFVVADAVDGELRRFVWRNDLVE
ncbi:lysine amidinotransferase [Purpureocillium lavendulum]|uniref:Lysine amidinotransferase n=1 Tax=Purpureocillium lavendulum TaxID=1247861 RepID=A0AB34FM50_9HYPO|nr:lysine amidinotransferase [Purpureocillium lavendulum]